MEEKYILNLLIQYNQAIGNPNLYQLDNGFLDWLKQYQKVLLELKNYYEYIGIYVDEEFNYEIGKGLLDSIILDKTHSISLFGSKKSELIVFDNTPLLVSGECISEFRGSNLLYTFNPYTISDLGLMKSLYQAGEHISVSMCGKKIDKDMEDKIKKLSDFFKLFEMKENYEEFDGNYFYSLTTPIKIKTRILTR